RRRSAPSRRTRAPSCRRISTASRATWRRSWSWPGSTRKVIEDCAHSLGATYRGHPTGSFGDGSFFSFQGFKPLNTYGGGLAWVRDADVAKKVWEFADAEEWPSEKRVESILRTGGLQHTFIRPRVFTLSLFPICYVASFTGSKPEERLWENHAAAWIQCRRTIAVGYRTCRPV